MCDCHESILPGGDTPSRSWWHRLDGGAAGLIRVVRSHGAWWVVTPVCVTKDLICVGALLGVWGSTRLFLLGSHVGWPRWLWLVVCGGCVV